MRKSLHLVLFLAATPAAISASEATRRGESLEYFEKHVRPLLASNCYNCHSASTNSKGGLRTDDRNGLLTGGGKGPAIMPGQPEHSLLIQAVKHTGDVKMPPGKKLSDEQIAVLERWIADGAVWPTVALPDDIGQYQAEYEELRASHWAWQPLKRAEVPAVREFEWPRSDIDRFVLAELEKAQLPPVSDAMRADLIRRVTYDLTGLPPTPANVVAFINDNREDAYERLVDRLMSSHEFAEHWARHWLDVARYGESTGSARNVPYPHAWRYRDYVISAFDRDTLYNQFIREQIAGDLLPADSDEQWQRQLIATGFLALGVKDVNQRFKVRFVMDNIDEQIDTVSRSVLALTVSCARCHDHKFDPVPTADYYALAGIFASTDLCAGVRNKMGGGGLDYYDTDMLLSLSATKGDLSEHREAIAAAKEAVEVARKEFIAVRDTAEADEKLPDGRLKRQAYRQKWNQKQAELLKLTDPAELGEVAFGVREATAIGDTEIRIRGEAEQLGPSVPRGFLSVLSSVPATPVQGSQSGRLELANWLVSDQNPLAARVAVNRIWQHLFGRGLVSTVDNFGITGDGPSHPDLLDHLAAEFVHDGWSVKRQIRRIVLSRTYRLSSVATPEHLKKDPQNRLLWRHAPRRLSAEEIRDSTLAASGALLTGRPAGSAAAELKVIEIRNNGPEAARIVAVARSSRHRSVYLPLLRGLTPISLSVFDFAEQGMVTGQRDQTNVPPQSLYLLNDAFVIREAVTIARRALREEQDNAQRVTAAYRQILGRNPDEVELRTALDFVREYSEVAFRSTAAKTGHEPIAATPAADGTAPQAADNVAANQNADDGQQPDLTAAWEQVETGDPETSTWGALCQALLASAEFRYVR